MNFNAFVSENTKYKRGRKKKMSDEITRSRDRKTQANIPLVDYSTKPRPVRQAPRKKKRRGSVFKPSVILVLLIACFVGGFLIYLKNYEIESKPSAKYAEFVKEQEDLADAAAKKSSQGDTSEVSDSSSSEGNSESQTKSGSTNPVPESAPKGDEYIDTCMFIGDSITSGLSSYRIVPADRVMSAIGVRPDNIETQKLQTMSMGKIIEVDAVEHLKEVKPENIYILLGSNGVAWMDNDVTISCYESFVGKIKYELPDSKIYIISLTPVGTMKENIADEKSGRVLNSQIDSFNEKLLAMADRSGVYYVDANSELKGPNGKLPDDETSDGMHFISSTYKKFLDYLLCHTAE